MFLLILTLKYVFAIINRIFYYRLEFQQNKEKSQAGWEAVEQLGGRRWLLTQEPRLGCGN